jgi:hypothetical protein
MSEDIKAHAILLQQQLDAITGTDIAHIRHSDGGIDLAKRVVNLKNAADWLIHAICSPGQPQDPAHDHR